MSFFFLVIVLLSFLDMSSSLFDRLLLTFINVKHRLESLLHVCRTYEDPLWKNDDYYDEYYRFHGPDMADIEELEVSIVFISSLIENFQHEQNTNEPFPHYPLCKDGWTVNDIEQLEKNQCSNLDITDQIRLLIRSQYHNERQHSTRNLNVNIQKS